jgi:succinate dehydrogenase / fumarate reductase iron-sulfur subunit
MNCADVCPKGLSPAKAISGIKEMQFKNKKKSVRKIFSLKKESS